MKYLVMECRPAYAVVLGDDGTFLKVANMRYEVGQTVTDVIPLNLPEVTEQPKTNPRRWISAVSALAACLVLVLSVFLTEQMPYASVYLTINPKVRIDVSRSDTVVGVEGMNTDGAALLEGYDHKKKVLDTVMDELVDRAIDLGYLHEGGRITLSLDGDEKWIVSHETHLNQHLNDHLTDKLTVTIDIEQGQPSQPTHPGQTIVIPVEPDYDDSDYGETMAPTSPPVQVPDRSDDSGYGDIPEDGETDYEEESDYEDVSDYEEESDYEEVSDYEEESDYEEISDSEGESDYEDIPGYEEESDYEETSDYEEASDYQEVTDYDEDESDYEADSDYDD